MALWWNQSKQETPKPRERPVVVADMEDTSADGTFDNSNITYNGSLVNFDYDSILRDKQGNIEKLYQ